MPRELGPFGPARSGAAWPCSVAVPFFHAFFTPVETSASRRAGTLDRTKIVAIGSLLPEVSMSLHRFARLPHSRPAIVRSLQQYEQALELSVSYYARSAGDDPERRSTPIRLRHAAHCLRAGLMVMATDRDGVPLLTQSIEADRGAGSACERSRACARRGGARLAARRLRGLDPPLWRHPARLSRATCWRCRSRTSATSFSAPRRCCATASRRCCRRGTRARRATATCSACTRSAWRRPRCIRAPKTPAGARSRSIRATPGPCTPSRT